MLRRSAGLGAIVALLSTTIRAQTPSAADAIGPVQIDGDIYNVTITTSGSTVLSLTTSYSTTTLPACATQLSQSDVDNSWFDPCPQYFDPLPTQGALSGSSLTMFGLPILADLSGSYLGADGTSTTYALTCDSDDTNVNPFSPCTATGAVFDLTASGWNWHVLTTQNSSYGGLSTVLMTETIQPSGAITYSYIAHVTPPMDAYNTSAYLFTETWTGTVALADPTVASIAGLAKASPAGGSMSGSGSSASTNRFTTTGAATTAGGSSPSGTTPTPSKGGAVQGSVLVRFSSSSREGMLIAGGSFVIAALAICL